MKLLLLSLILSPLAAFVIGAIVPKPWRTIGLLAALIAPLLVYTAWLGALHSSDPHFWQWWTVGLLYGAVRFGLSAAATLVCFYIGKSFARSAGAA